MLNPWILLGWVVAFCLAVLVFLIMVALAVAILSPLMYPQPSRPRRRPGPIPTSLEVARRLHPSSRQRL